MPPLYKGLCTNYTWFIDQTSEQLSLVEGCPQLRLREKQPSMRYQTSTTTCCQYSGTPLLERICAFL